LTPHDKKKKRRPKYKNYSKCSEYLSYHERSPKNRFLEEHRQPEHQEKIRRIIAGKTWEEREDIRTKDFKSLRTSKSQSKVHRKRREDLFKTIFLHFSASKRTEIPKLCLQQTE